MAPSLQLPCLNTELADRGTSGHGADSLLADVLEKPGVRGENTADGYVRDFGDYDDVDD